MTSEELILMAREAFAADGVSSVREACEEFYGNGFADEVSGDVEEPSEGHFYRVGRWIVATDSQGFHYVDEYESEPAAVREFSQREERAAAWYDQETVL